MTIGDMATAYAAVVATIVGAVQIWQQLRSGPRLRVAVATNISIIPGDDLDRDMIGVTVVNIGTSPTTLDGLSVIPREKRFFRRNADEQFHYFIPNPQPAHTPAILPKQLNPGDKWQGFIRLNEKSPNFRNGEFSAAISSTMHLKPIKAPIPKSLAATA